MAQPHYLGSVTGTAVGLLTPSGTGSTKQVPCNRCGIKVEYRKDRPGTWPDRYVCLSCRESDPEYLQMTSIA